MNKFLFGNNTSVIVRTRTNSGERDEYGSPVKTVVEKSWPVLWAWGASSTERALQYSLESRVATIYCTDEMFTAESDSEIIYEGEVFKPTGPPQKWVSPKGFVKMNGVVLEVSRVVSA